MISELIEKLRNNMFPWNGFSEQLTGNLTGNFCSKCLVKKARLNQRYCKDCHAQYQRENRKKYSDLSPREKKKATCRAYANVYQRRGKLMPEPCCNCKSTDNIQKHHNNFSRPLDVQWYCGRCLRGLHNGTVASPEMKLFSKAKLEKLNGR